MTQSEIKQRLQLDSSLKKTWEQPWNSADQSLLFLFWMCFLHFSIWCLFTFTSHCVTYIISYIVSFLLCPYGQYFLFFIFFTIKFCCLAAHCFFQCCLCIYVLLKIFLKRPHCLWEGLMDQSLVLFIFCYINIQTDLFLC